MVLGWLWALPGHKPGAVALAVVATCVLMFLSFVVFFVVAVVLAFAGVPGYDLP